MKLSMQQAKEMMKRNSGSLDLRGTLITALPDGLTVGRSLFLNNTLITALPDGLTVGGWIDLGGTPITALPDGLTVGGSLSLNNTPITALPDGLTVGGSLYINNTPITTLPDGLTVGGSLDLRGTPITALPDGLTVGGSLFLNNTPITALPDRLTVGGCIDLGGTPITALPDGLTVGGWIDLRGTKIKNKEAEQKKVRKLQNGDYIEGRYLFCDGILTHVKKRKMISGYMLYIGKIKGKNVVSDGKHYAHCETFREGVADLLFKAADERGAEQYRGLTLDTVLTAPEMVTMYRVITGACRQGTQIFVDSIKNLKETYTIREAIELTRGQYNWQAFAEFFDAA